MFGTIIDIFIPKKLGEPRAIAFVHFKQADEVDHLLKLKPEIVIGGKKVSIARARRPVSGGSSLPMVESRKVAGEGKLNISRPCDAKGSEEQKKSLNLDRRNHILVTLIGMC